MLGWFKKRRSTNAGGDVKAFADSWFGPQALAVAMAEIVSAYAHHVKAGQVSYPAHRRNGASVVEIWHDLRIEALQNLFNFGQAEPFILSEQQRQIEALDCFLDERPYLEMPQPRGEVVPDTIQAMFQVYLYLDEVGTEVADRETDRATLKSKGESVLDGLITQASVIRDEWRGFEDAIRSKRSLPEMPRTLLEILFDDVTAKAKSIALSTVFGPSYEAGIRHMENLVEKRGGGVSRVRESMERVMAAKDPDEIVQ